MLHLSIFLLKLSLFFIHGFDPLTDGFLLYHGFLLELCNLVIFEIELFLKLLKLRDAILQRSQLAQLMILRQYAIVQDLDLLITHIYLVLEILLRWMWSRSSLPPIIVVQYVLLSLELIVDELKLFLFIFNIVLELPLQLFLLLEGLFFLLQI